MEELANKLVITNLHIGSTNTEYPMALPKGCRSFVLHVRTAVAIRIAFQAQLVATSTEPYFTLKANTSISSTELGIDVKEGLMMYFAGGTACVVEAIFGIYDKDKE